MLPEICCVILAVFGILQADGISAMPDNVAGELANLTSWIKNDNATFDLAWPQMLFNISASVATEADHLLSTILTANGEDASEEPINQLHRMIEEVENVSLAFAIKLQNDFKQLQAAYLQKLRSKVPNEVIKSDETKLALNSPFNFLLDQYLRCFQSDKCYRRMPEHNASLAAVCKEQLDIFYDLTTTSTARDDSVFQLAQYLQLSPATFIFLPMCVNRGLLADGGFKAEHARHLEQRFNVLWKQHFEQEIFSNETMCRMPHLELNDPLIQPFLKDYAKLQCAKERNWVYTEKGMFLITDHAVQQYGLDAINCTYVDLTRPHDETYEEHFHASFANGSQLMHEAFVADCFTETAKYRNVHIGVPYAQSLHQRKPVVASNGLDLNVYLYLLDSMSRINFIRKLPKFYQLLTGELNAIVMEGFNIVGDGTPWTMIPVTTGHFQTELYEARKRFENASYVDDWPLVFKDYKNAGYITSYSEEQPAFSFFSYKLKGFEKPPVDHYLRVFQQAANYESSYHKPYCLGDRAKSLVLCDWWKEQQDMYSPENIRTFSLLFSSETSHDDYNLVQALDEHWETSFRQQYEAGYFNNTLLIVMGDHGRRFGAVRQTQSGKTEEKLPFLALVLPDWFRERYPNAWDNLKTNSKRLVNPFDIHATLIDVLNFSEADDDFSNLTPRNISLFKKIPAGRTCAQAAIKAHFCACLDWENLEPDKPDVQKAVAYALAKINEANAEAGPGICAMLRLNQTISARLLKPNENLLAFKESQDYDNIFPDLSDAANVTAVLYQLRFLTAPNGGDYEVSLNFYANTGQFSLSFDDVSRLNMYGNQPHCNLNTHQQLRQFCFCNDLLLRTNNSTSSKEANPEDASNLGLVTLPEPDVIAVTDSTGSTKCVKEKGMTPLTALQSKSLSYLLSD